MKKIALIAAICIIGYGAQSSKIGFGVASIDRPYKGAESRIIPLPYLDIRHGGFYFRGLEAGYSAKADGALELSGFVKARLDGYSHDDSEYLNGMDSRRDTLEGGGRVSFDANNIGKISLFAAADLLGRHSGYEVGVECSKMFVSQSGLFIPFVSLKQESRELTEYYYGVKAQEARAQRKAYSPKGALNAEIGGRYIYNLTQKSSIVTAVSYGWLDSEIYDSPIVEDKTRLKAFVAYGYSF